MTRAALVVTALGLGSCNKVPIYAVNAGFNVADTAWFEDEETLFVFWEVQAEQGLGDPSVVEITWATDTERVDWTPVVDLEMVHTHVPVDCGHDELCGSASIHIPLEPREVQLRLRYHVDGELALEPDTVFNVINSGPSHSSRSLVVYGVFDETNQFVQWRGRHQFPTLRNEHATDLGLRRWFSVDEQTYGTAVVATEGNPFAYGIRCPEDFVDAAIDGVETERRAAFNDQSLPLAASDDALVCGASTVSDATGRFTTPAFAHKNPEVRPAFPMLRSPIEQAARVDFFIAPCTRVISEDHEEMQRQRILRPNLETTCSEGWQGDDWVDDLAAQISDAIEARRPQGDDMVLVVGLHRDEPGLADAVEEALLMVVPEERHRASPRLAGAWVFDSATREVSPDLTSSTLWCPAEVSDDANPLDPALRSCPIAPDNPDLELGPFSFGTLPILTDRADYLDFIDTYSKRQAGEVKALEFSTPYFATTTEHIDLGSFGTITFLNDESIDADPTDAFSYCPVDSPLNVFFRSDIIADAGFYDLIAADCDEGVLDPTFCDAAAAGVLPLSFLPEWHGLAQESRYDLGIFWDFPFLLRMEFEAFLAGQGSAFNFSVPFGIGTDGEQYLGTFTWTTETFSLEDELGHCTRFCDHPTFDSAGVYHVTDLFRATYASSCYRPVYPDPEEDYGFPRDP